MTQEPRIILSRHYSVYCRCPDPAPDGAGFLGRLWHRVRLWCYRDQTHWKDNPVWSFCELKAYQYLAIPMPPGEVHTVVARAKRVAAPDGWKYPVDGWDYRPEDNTYVGKIKGYDPELSSYEVLDPGSDLKKHVIEKWSEIVKDGWGDYPNRKTITYRGAHPAPGPL